MNDPTPRRIEHRELTLAVLTVLALPLAANAQPPAPAPAPATFTAEQAARGRVEYERSCLVCHGENLAGGPFAQPLTGSRFRDRWAGHSMDRLFTQVRTTMPPDRAGQLSRSTYADLLAYILEVNGAPASDQPLPAETETLAALFVAVGERSSMQARMRSSGPGGFFADGVVLPEWPAPADPLAGFRPATDALLENPPAGSWLHWRGDYESLGFSRLDRIDKQNVSSLGVAWTLSLPPGPNESTPLVHDGVMFVHSYGDHIHALNAATGDELWHYARELPEGTNASVKRNISIYGDKLYAATSDGHVVALDAMTGNVVWERALEDNPRMTGGPLVARGVVMQGTDGRRPGGAFLQAFAAETGEPLWRFNTIPRPGEPGGDSWNGLPWEARSGGTIWTSGSFDPRTGLAYLGPAPTYDTGPLLTPVGQSGITNDALYTNSTVALEPETGRIAWHFQHVSNDQFDLDWAFERTIADVEIDGMVRRVLVTAGKGGFHDALDAATGEYLFSFDMGLQNLILGANRETGAKLIDESLLPDAGDDKRTKTVCPHAGGGRSWIPSALNPETRILYVPAVETCMDLVPVPEGENAALSSGYQWRLRPRPDSDGRYGRIQAIAVASGETLWTERQRAPQSTGVLATAGGLVFAGALDRWLTAYDDATGEALWRVRLNDVPNSNPISYEVDGTQYIAMVVGYGGAQVASFPRLTPEIPLPATRSSAVWVFELK
jgi:alcohol dehydrogenase (cytochrome c)